MYLCFHSINQTSVYLSRKFGHGGDNALGLPSAKLAKDGRRKEKEGFSYGHPPGHSGLKSSRGFPDSGASRPDILADMERFFCYAERVGKLRGGRL